MSVPLFFLLLPMVAALERTEQLRDMANKLVLGSSANTIPMIRNYLRKINSSENSAFLDSTKKGDKIVNNLVKVLRKYTPFMKISYTLGGTTKENTVRFELFWDKAKKTSLNFALLVMGLPYGKDKILSYKGSKFHRIIKNFMIQGGVLHDEKDSLKNISVYGSEFADEFDSSLHNDVGSLSMANRGPNTNTSQFFINVAENRYLDGKHTVFGKVLDKESLNIVMEIQNVKTQQWNNDQPEPSVSIIDAGFLDKNGNLMKDDVMLDHSEL